MKRFMLTVVLLVFVAASGTGCVRRPAAGNQATEPREETFVQVDNRAFLDATVYVLRGGQRIRLGLVNGSSIHTFTLPSHVMFGTTSLAFQIDFVGNSRAPYSNSISVVPGDTVVLSIPPQ